MHLSVHHDATAQAAARLNLTRGLDGAYRGTCPCCGYGKPTLSLSVRSGGIAVSCFACGEVARIPEEWFRKVPQYQRSGTNPVEKMRYLEVICDLVARRESRPRPGPGWPAHSGFQLAAPPEPASRTQGQLFGGPAPRETARRVVEATPTSVTVQGEMPALVLNRRSYVVANVKACAHRT
jgi:hypothetical protein